jgi:hypothetical protein
MCKLIYSKFGCKDIQALTLKYFLLRDIINIEWISRDKVRNPVLDMGKPCQFQEEV